MYNIMYETSRQSRFDARYWMLGTGALGRPRGRVGEGGGRRVQRKKKKMMISLMEKIHMLVKLCSGMSYGASGPEFSVNESPLYIRLGDWD